MIRKEIEAYIEAEILPRYRSFDKAHQENHARAVIDRALALSVHYDVDPEMIYVAAAYHDTGLVQGRKTHHLVSATILREDPRLREWFTPDQIETMACAAEDHRASSDHAPRTLYGRIIAEADRMIVPECIIRRTVQYGLDHEPERNREGHWQRTLDHLHEKYAEGGYLKLWIPESPNREALERLRQIIRDEGALRRIFDAVFDEETAGKGTT